MNPEARGRDEVPERVGAYEIVARLGASEKGIVYEGIDPTLERRVAIKLLPPTLAANERTSSSFRDEARLLARLSHPNIATIYSLETAGSDTFITMEHVPGESLRRILSQGPLDPDRLLGVARELASALEAAHVEGIAHHDLKPSNVVLATSGEVKVLDFGVAKLVDEEALPRDTPGEEIDVRAFGHLVYACASGRPFAGAAAPGRPVPRGAPDLDIGALPDALAGPVRELIARCLTGEPAPPASMAEARRVIEGAIERRARGRLDAGAEDAPRRAPSRLPRYLTSFVGRERELDELARRLESERLVTLTGAGGAGKTRLAVEAARRRADRREDGARFVALAPVTDPAMAWQAVLGVLDVSTERGRTPRATLIDALRTRDVLIVIDNCEHLHVVVRELVTALLCETEHVTILSTSRRRLGVDGETVLAVTPFEVPAGTVELGSWAESAAVRLFTDRASALGRPFELTNENLETVTDLLRRIDGLPLAIELAAARANVLTPGEISRRLDERFRILRSSEAGRPDRHESLEALMGWSVELLSEKEEAAFRRLSVFRGGFTAESAERVCAIAPIASWDVLGLIASLREHSLIERVAESGAGTERSRYRMLETVRVYADGRLAAASERAAMRQRYFEWVAELARASDLHGGQQRTWRSRLADENGNILAALQLVETDEIPLDEATRIGCKLMTYWLTTGRWHDARVHQLRVTEKLRARGMTGTRLHALALRARGDAAFSLGDMDDARACLEESVAIAKALGDPKVASSARTSLGNVEMFSGNLERALAHYDATLYTERADDDRGRVDRAVSHHNRAEALAGLGRYREAEAAFQTCLELREAVGHVQGVAQALTGLARMRRVRGDHDASRELFARALAIRRDLGDRRGLVVTLLNLCTLALEREDFEEARGVAHEALEVAEGFGDRRGIATALSVLGSVDLELSELDRARSRFERSLVEARAVSYRVREGDALLGLAGVARRSGDLDAARRLGLDGLAVVRDTPGEGLVHAVEHLAQTAIDAKDHRRAARYLAAAERLQSEMERVVPEGAAKRSREWRRRLRKALGDEAFEAAWRQGSDSSLDVVFPRGGEG